MIAHGNVWAGVSATHLLIYLVLSWARSVCLCVRNTPTRTHTKKKASSLPRGEIQPANGRHPQFPPAVSGRPRPPRPTVTDKPSVPTRTSASTCRSTPAHLAADKVVQCRCGHDTNLPYKYFTYPLGIPKNRTLCAASHYYYYYLFFPSREDPERSAFLSSVGVSARRRRPRRSFSVVLVAGVERLLGADGRDGPRRSLSVLGCSLARFDAVLLVNSCWYLLPASSI